MVRDLHEWGYNIGREGRRMDAVVDWVVLQGRRWPVVCSLRLVMMMMEVVVMMVVMVMAMMMVVMVVVMVM